MTHRPTLLTSVSPLPYLAARQLMLFDMAHGGREVLRKIGRDPRLVGSLSDRTLAEVAAVATSIGTAPPGETVAVTASPLVADLLRLRRKSDSRIT